MSSKPVQLREPPASKTHRPFGPVVVAALTIAWFALAATPPAVAQDGTLSTIRQDVREGEPASPARLPPPDAPSRTSNSGSDPDLPLDPSLFLAGAMFAGVAASSPIWGPIALTQEEDIVGSGYFPRFPYNDFDGYIQSRDTPSQTKPWSVRFDAEYAETFDSLDNVLGGHLLIDTAPRFGLTASYTHLEERLADDSRDRLELGDCNLVYRFAQCDWAEFRTGLGANWMADSRQTDLGFNFTYAADFFPRKPWVVSAVFDWGTLGRAGLFRFRTTAGVVFYGVETYVGYEYTDIGLAHWNALVAGLRFWF